MADVTHFHDLSSIAPAWDEGLTILMYHAIERPQAGYDMQWLYVDPRKLRAQISELKDAGAQFIRTSNLIGAGKGRQVFITLDDGFENVFTNAMPVFNDLGVPAIAYIVAGRIGGTNTWDAHLNLPKRPLMTREQILEWARARYEIGAHTMTHPNLTQIPLAEARREIFDSKKVLEDLLGRPVVHFCYPFGGWNAQLRDLVREAGFETAMARTGGFNTPATGRLTLRRIVASHRDPVAAAAGDPLA
jgi:peptidoglycan/xylan/chitin deacetylase (PgdA/CDA1 family)